MKELKEMTVEELENLISEAQEMLREKRMSNKVFKFHFEYENDYRKGKPYVARLFMKDGKLQRKFFDLEQVWSGKRDVLVSGDYEAHAGDIIEERQGGSWKNDYRYWFVITENGEKVMVADIDDGRAKALVLNYLRGKINLPALLQKVREAK